VAQVIGEELGRSSEANPRFAFAMGCWVRVPQSTSLPSPSSSTATPPPCVVSRSAGDGEEGAGGSAS